MCQEARLSAGGLFHPVHMPQDVPLSRPCANHEHRAGDQSEAMPAFSLIANRQRMPLAHTETVRQALLRLRPTSNPGDARMLSRWGKNIRNGAKAAADSDFGVVRRMLQNTNIPEQSGF